jgi:hypothetical protein
MIQFRYYCRTPWTGDRPIARPVPTQDSTTEKTADIRGCIQKFPDWPPGARTIIGTVLCHYLQLYRYFVNQSSDFCRHNPVCCLSTSVYCCYCLFRYDSVRKLFGHTVVRPCVSGILTHNPTARAFQDLMRLERRGHGDQPSQ